MVNVEGQPSTDTVGHWAYDVFLAEVPLAASTSQFSLNRDSLTELYLPRLPALNEAFRCNVSRIAQPKLVPAEELKTTGQ